MGSIPTTPIYLDGEVMREQSEFKKLQSLCNRKVGKMNPSYRERGWKWINIRTGKIIDPIKIPQNERYSDKWQPLPAGIY